MPQRVSRPVQELDSFPSSSGQSVVLWCTKT
ncbi:unnamed product [Ostreococcus tauri]|uniref:Unnamed product n=1 Tax=Ostreococcus tauri TaxID=70448 RepID=A0A096P8D6_OSTTA|nr:unnamed product [Ostreococcus tauri]CEG00247.1 unnamed product [Ostreococcus tauri]|eukprot:XP_022840277.1 unnamed product [Ostreococcus tauri]